MTDAQKDSRQFRGQRLLASLRERLSAMRLALEEEDLPAAAGDDGHGADMGSGGLPGAVARQAGIRRDLAELAQLTEYAPGLESAARSGLDRDALQAFRRAAMRDTEALERRFAALAATTWRSASDAERAKACRTSALRWGIWLLAAAIALAGWTGWQRQRQAALRAGLDAVKAESARQALMLISQAAWQAMHAGKRPLAAIAPDMTADCAGIDVRATLPNHPCRQAWDRDRQAIFQACIPSPGLPWNAPSEIFFDPWNSPYVLESAATPPTVRSAGPDGRLGTADDIAAPVPYWGPGGDASGSLPGSLPARP